MQEGIVNISFVEHSEHLSNEQTVNTPIKPQVTSYGSIDEEVSRVYSKRKEMDQKLCILFETVCKQAHYDFLIFLGLKMELLITWP